MYRIIGADGKEYGPISAEQLRQWIAEGRANGQTRVLFEGTTDWKTLGEIPEFGLTTAAAAPSATIPGTLYAPVMAKNNPMAITGLIMGVLSLILSCCCYGLPFNILGIIFSLIGLSQIKQNPQLYTGRGLAIAGLICSIVSIILAILIFAIWGIVGASDMMHKLRQMQ